MEYKWLQSFIVAAQTCNFRTAAEQLHLSQPSITVHIQQLEEFLHVQLFKREKNRVQLTDTGRLFQVEAQEMVKQWELSIERIRLASKGIQEKVMIAMTPLMVETILPHVIYQFINDNPSLEISILVEDSAKIEDLVNQDQAHIGISLLPTRYRHWHQELLIDSPLEFVIPLDAYDDETGTYIDYEELFQTYTLFTHHHPTIWGELLRKLREKYVLTKQVSISQSYVVKRLIKDGLGLSFLPRMIVRKERMEGRFNIVPFEDLPLPSVPVYFFYKESTQVPDGLLDLLQTRNYL
ncbi:LysR family transcriptional regulator [Lysinibacillus sp. HST-98]|uniref:LysR family transcriptional regulator n=1 Tax=Lysinibacillus sp. HST-98 TaxID=2800419 RepID=UPI001928D937|nr:LysR family transcriptional regulator [Lysinibacillus sp. HST-98]MBL3728361.1 LysR family transcriptional regulator [Lysinibacillus sp. HST-98]